MTNSRKYDWFERILSDKYICYLFWTGDRRPHLQVQALGFADQLFKMLLIEKETSTWYDKQNAQPEQLYLLESVKSLH